MVVPVKEEDLQVQIATEIFSPSAMFKGPIDDTARGSDREPFQPAPRVGQEHGTPKVRAGIPRSLSQVSTAASLGTSFTSTDDRKGGRAIVLEEVRKYAYCAADLGVLARFLDLQLFDGHKTIAVSPPKEVLRLVLRAMKLLHLCDFVHEDICCILAHTSVYFRSTYKMCGHQMDAQEVANAMVAQMFIAHSYVQDETCPLRVWHEHVFHKYCSVKTLNAVVMRLIEIRGFRLRLERKDMTKRYKYLVGSQPDVRAGYTGLSPPLEATSEHARSSERSSCGSTPRCPEDRASPRSSPGGGVSNPAPAAL
jgi:hypothetical protein